VQGGFDGGAYVDLAAPLAGVFGGWGDRRGRTTVFQPQFVEGGQDDAHDGQVDTDVEDQCRGEVVVLTARQGDVGVQRPQERAVHETEHPGNRRDDDAASDDRRVGQTDGCGRITGCDQVAQGESGPADKTGDEPSAGFTVPPEQQVRGPDDEQRHEETGDRAHQYRVGHGRVDGVGVGDVDHPTLVRGYQGAGVEDG